ncbi:unnamed protein product [Cylicocyclus nassatus]|uniref:Uncharacterized protein n=1 Tax=Cylicocyclus nassatus TaxID=53992 RepID=A0AA36M4J6_CYLNA|nr:unnamed protein product [Cylicocyclus nassatus]
MHPLRRDFGWWSPVMKPIRAPVLYVRELDRAGDVGEDGLSGSFERLLKAALTADEITQENMRTEEDEEIEDAESADESDTNDSCLDRNNTFANSSPYSIHFEQLGRSDRGAVMSTTYLTGEMDFIDVTAEATSSFSPPQQGLPGGTFTAFSKAMSVWREELCELQRSARIRNSQSLMDHTAQTPTDCSHEASIDAHHSGTGTGHIFATSNENGAFWEFDRCCAADQVLEQKWVASERQFKEGVSHESPIEFATPTHASENEGIENGRVVAYVLFIGATTLYKTCCKLLSNGISLHIHSTCYRSIPDPTKVASLNEKSAENCKIHERVAELEMQNQQLAFELERQKQTTEALLRQLDHFTSRSYSSRSVSENNFQRKMMRE